MIGGFIRIVLSIIPEKRKKVNSQSKISPMFQIVVCRHGRQQMRYHRSRVSMGLWDLLGIDGKYRF
jgi:hypothetical protein